MPDTPVQSDALALPDDLPSWLRLQLDADERIARAAHPGPWEWSDRGWEGRLTADAPGYHRIVTVAEPENDESAVDFLFMAEFGPDRRLREVEAKRRIVDACQRDLAARGDGATEGQVDRVTWDVVCLLALPYSDRPGYRQEWAP